MKYLEELQVKVLHMVNKNAELCSRIDELLLENASLREQSSRYEVALMKEAHVTQSLTQEKTAILKTIEDLLQNINDLEAGIQS